MDRTTTTVLRVGAWRVDPVSGEISRDGETTRLEVRAMRLLLCLANRAGEVVSIDDLLNQVWPEVTVTPDSVYQAVASLRRLLGDDPKQPTHIETVPRLGYRMVASVSLEPSQSSGPAPSNSAPAASGAGARPSLSFLWTIGAVLVIAVVAAVLVRGKLTVGNRSASAASAAEAQNSVAVLPFLDLTKGMKEETFADGITEELIDRLSKIPSVRVASPTSSFYFKGKRVPVVDIAKSLGVNYVLDGSLQKSGTWVRVDVRLIQASNGFVIWAQNYDQPMTDIFTIQDDIAGKVSKSLQASINSNQSSDHR